MEIVFIVVGIVIGFALAFFYLKSKGNPQNIAQTEWEKEKAVLAERVQSLERDKRELNQKYDSATARGETLAADLGRMKGLLQSEEEQIEKLKKDRELLKIEFENVANKILDEKSEKFTSLNRTNLDTILNPLHQRIEDFQKKVDEVYKTEAGERNSLKGEILQLIQRTREVSDVATNLARALEGDAKQQGDWGELVLERILEFSGLRKDSEYTVQESFATEEGRQRPDAIIYLPDNKHIIIDATAYKRCVEATNEEDRVREMSAHISSVRSHIKGLAERNYQAIKELNQPDFVLLFMPIESSFGLAVQADDDLFSYAWERKIVIVSPSTLLATLRTIASIWKQERQTRNALEIADRAGKMYDKLVGFMEDMVSVGKKMDEATSTYQKAMTKFSTGSGNLIKQAEDMKKLGAKAQKQLPQSLLDRAE
jgi:DNA recombination protein RmuC